MAYGNYYPVNYQPNYYGGAAMNGINPYYQQQPNPAMMQQPQQQTQQAQPQQIQQPTIQQSGFVLVQSEQEARAYPVAPGNSITFKDESQPYCYVKTMGFNQLDRPTFERYRLVKEEMPSETPSYPVTNERAEESNRISYALKSDLDAVREELDELKAKVKSQVDKKVTKTKKQPEDLDNDE